MAALAMMVAGCNDTAAGMKEDTKDNMNRAEQKTDDMKDQSEDAGAKMEEGAKDLAAAGTLTPMIKTAIVANPLLNDPGNKIDVNSNDETVTLVGVVQSDKMKAEAEKIAMEVMKDNKAHQTLKNELKVAQ